MTYLDYLEQKVLLERLVIGLEQPVLIKGLGELSAKIDSGNGGYNVIHGTDFHQQGNELMFTTHDSFGHEKKMQATVIDTIEVNMGGGNIESRPVIELDIKFAGEDYKKIPFSVSDRSSNTNPILISKGFVENELEALIDVGAMNISHEGIDVVYGESVVTEGILGTIGSGLKKTVGGAWDATKGIVKAGASAIKNAGEILHGQQGAFDGIKAGLKQTASGLASGSLGAITATLGAAVGGIVLLYKGGKGAISKTKAWWASKIIVQHKKIIESDKKVIQDKLSGLSFANEVIKDPNLDKTSNIILSLTKNDVDYSQMPINVVATYMMNKGEGNLTIKGMQNKKDALKKWLQNNKEAIKAYRETLNNGSYKQQKPQEEQQEELVVEAISLLQASESTPTPAPVQPTQQVTPTLSATPDASSGEPADSSSSTDDEQSNPDNQKAIQDAEKELEQKTTFLHQLNNFVLYFISIRNDKKMKDGVLNDIKQRQNELAELEKQLQQEKAEKENEQPSEEPQGEEGQKEPETVGESFESWGEIIESFISAGNLVQARRNAQEGEFAPNTTEQKIALCKKQIESLKKQLQSNMQDSKGHAEKGVAEFIKTENFDQRLIPLYSSGRINESSVEPIVKKLAQYFQTQVQQKGSDWGQGIFCLMYTPLDQNAWSSDANETIKGRICHFFESPDCIPYKKIQQKTEQQPAQQQQEDAWIENKLNHFRTKGLI